MTDEEWMAHPLGQFEQRLLTFIRDHRDAKEMTIKTVADLGWVLDGYVDFVFVRAPKPGGEK